MAIIKLPDGAEIRGKLGGRVYARNRYGNYARGKTQNVNPRTIKQVNLRALFATISSNWRTLDASEQQDWNDAAQLFPKKNKVGDTIFLTGSAFYTSTNVKLAKAGLPTTNKAPMPTSFRDIQITIVKITWDGAKIEMETTGTLSEDFAIILNATQQFSTGVNFTSRSKYKQIGTLQTAQISTLTDITARYNEVFGALSTTTDQNVFFEVTAIFKETGETIEIGKYKVEYNL